MLPMLLLSIFVEMTLLLWYRSLIPYFVHCSLDWRRLCNKWVSTHFSCANSGVAGDHWAWVFWKRPLHKLTNRKRKDFSICFANCSAAFNPKDKVPTCFGCTAHSWSSTSGSYWLAFSWIYLKYSMMFQAHALLFVFYFGVHVAQILLGKEGQR